MTATVDPGPVPEHDPDDVVPTTAERLATLRWRARAAQDAAGWGDPATPVGAMAVAGAVVELSRVVADLIGLVQRGEIAQPRDAQ